MHNQDWTTYQDYLGDNYYEHDAPKLSEEEWNAMVSGAPLSFDDRQRLIERLNEIMGSILEDRGYLAEFQARPTPGPWAQAERDQLFDWLHSFVSRYVDLAPMFTDEIDSYVSPWRPGRILTIWRELTGPGQSEMKAERIAELLSQEESIEAYAGEHYEIEGEWLQDLGVRLVQEMPDGSPEALGLLIHLDLTAPRGGRPPVLHGR